MGTVLTRVRSIKMTKRTIQEGPFVDLTEPGPVDTENLPLKAFDYTSRTKLIIDKLVDLNVAWNLQTLRDLIRQNQWGNLPVELKPRLIPHDCPPVTKQVVVRRKTNRNFDVVKVLRLMFGLM